MPVCLKARVNGRNTGRRSRTTRMHLFLTDRLFCPSCGPEFGLILLAREIRDRRVLDGDLGCSRCRATFPVRRGFADLRASPRSPPPLPNPPSSSPPGDPEEALRLGALLGVTEGPGTLLIVGPAARVAEGVAGLVDGVEVVGLDAALADGEESEGVSRIAAGPVIPFFPGTFQGVVLSGAVGESEVEEAVRVLAPHRRLVVPRSSPEVSREVEALGLMILLEEGGVLVAEKRWSEVLPLVTLRGV